MLPGFAAISSLYLSRRAYAGHSPLAVGDASRSTAAEVVVPAECPKGFFPMGPGFCCELLKLGHPPFVLPFLECRVECPAGTTDCGPLLPGLPWPNCVDTQTDPNHCGTCGTNCTVEGEICQAGQCVANCCPACCPTATASCKSVGGCHLFSSEMGSQSTCCTMNRACCGHASNVGVCCPDGYEPFQSSTHPCQCYKDGLYKPITCCPLPASG